MKLLVVAACVVLAAADRLGSAGGYGAPSGAQPQYGAPPGAQSRYGTPSGAQSQYGAPSGAQPQYGSSSSSGYGLQSRRRPFQSSLKPADNRGYGQQQSNGGYGQQSNGGYGQQSNGGYGQAEQAFPPQPYSFSYDVLDVRGNDFGAAEESNGEEVQGQYSVLLPDGRVQTVSYSVQGESGFVADLEYEGEAVFVDAYGQEEGRSNVRRGNGPTADRGHGYGQGSGYGRQKRY